MKEGGLDRRNLLRGALAAAGAAVAGSGAEAAQKKTENPELNLDTLATMTRQLLAKIEEAKRLKDEPARDGLDAVPQLMDELKSHKQIRTFAETLYKITR